MRPHASPGPDTWSTPHDGRTFFVRILGDPVPVWLHWIEPPPQQDTISVPSCRQKHAFASVRLRFISKALATEGAITGKTNTCTPAPPVGPALCDMMARIKL